MNGWCGLNEDEQEWLVNLERFVNQRIEKVSDVSPNLTHQEYIELIATVSRDTYNARCQILRLKERIKTGYGKFGV